MRSSFCLSLLFLPTLFFSFVTASDAVHVTRNARLWAPFAAVWTSPFEGLYIPVTYSAWWSLARVSRWFTGHLDASWFHGLNWALHGFNVGLAWLCLRRLRLGVWGAAAAAVIFAVHPLQVEAVAWVSALKDVLVSTFVLACVLSALSARWKTATFFFGLALLTKPVAAVAPAMVAVLLWMSGQPVRSRAPWLVGWFTLSAAILLLTKFLQPVPGYGPWESVLVVSDSLLFSVAKTLFPVGLTLNHGHTPESVIARGPGMALVALLLMGALLWRFRERRWLVGAAALFLLPWLPVSGLVPFFSQMQSTTADRFLYLSVFGFALAAGPYFEAKPLRVAILTLVLALGTRVGLRHWRDDVSVYLRLVNVKPVAENRYLYGTALYEAGRGAEAVDLLGQACAQDPLDARYPNKLAMVLAEQGRIEEAQMELRGALAWLPDSPTLSENLEILERRKIALNQGGKKQ